MQDSGMNICASDLYRFRLRLARALTLKTETLYVREGFLLRLTDANGRSAWGEVAPLPAFSRETLPQAATELALLRPMLLQGPAAPPLALLHQGGEWAWPGPVPSAATRFGVESALLKLQAQSRQQELQCLLNSAAASKVPLNGLLSGTPAQIQARAAALRARGYKALKLKVGRLPLADELDLIARVRGLVGPDCRIRLDANRCWHVPEALEFMTRAAQFDIDYLEEPVKSYAQLTALAAQPSASMALALDESLLDLHPHELPRLPGFKAVVIKPMLLGFFRAWHFAQAARQRGLAPVISAAFESSIGLHDLACMAAAVHVPPVPAGLDTLDWLAEDLLQPPLRVESGAVTLAPDRQGQGHICRERLEAASGEDHPFGP